MLLGTAAAARADDAPAASSSATIQPAAATSPGALDGLLQPATWSVHEQATVVEQWHYAFPAQYSGPNSLQDTEEAERTFSSSLFLDHALWTGGELVYNPELLQGHGLSDTLGVAGFPNGEAAKSGFPNFHYNTSRLFFRQVVGLGGEREKLGDGVNQVAESVDVDRLTFSAGKFAASDFFDDNAYSHDPRTQFLNGDFWESAAWDYPADEVGYTAGFVTEWNTGSGTLRYGIFMEPRVANGAALDARVDKAHGQVLEYEDRYTWGGRAGAVRPFVYWNQADMGNYADASGQPYPEDVTLTRSDRSKAGFGVSWDQALVDDLGAFARLGWNDGRTESWAFTEIDRSLAAGVSAGGSRWGRPGDVLGLGVAVSALAPGHQAYLAHGGTGLVLGDGALSYEPEEIAETYYAFQPWPWLQVSPDCQYIANPGYNAARGPVALFAVRAHCQF